MLTLSIEMSQPQELDWSSLQLWFSVLIIDPSKSGLLSFTLGKKTAFMLRLETTKSKQFLLFFYLDHLCHFDEP